MNAITSNAPLRFRAIWISDVHLGTPGCQASMLLDFLRRTESEYLYLVGDIVDAVQLRKYWFWPQAHNDVLQKLIRKARKGTRVISVPGNHDALARQFAALAFGGIRIENETIHVTEDGKRLLVIHGDRFDMMVRHGTWLAHFGRKVFAAMTWLSQRLNALRVRVGMRYWLLVRFLNRRQRHAELFVRRFEDAAVDEARRLGVDGVVCGHIHKPDMRMIDGILYCNDGDWVDGATALVEEKDGQLRLIDWRGLPLPRIWRTRQRVVDGESAQPVVPVPGLAT